MPARNAPCGKLTVETLHDQHRLGNVHQRDLGDRQLCPLGEPHAEVFVAGESGKLRGDRLGLEDMGRGELPALDERPLTALFEDGNLVLKACDGQPHAAVPDREGVKRTRPDALREFRV